jgi:predicted  nucleic acid-binding Zn-ribbon protein
MINASKMVTHEIELDKEAERAFKNVTTTTTRDDFDEEFDSAFEIKNSTKSNVRSVDELTTAGLVDARDNKHERLYEQEREPVKTEGLPTSLPSSLG